MTNLSDKILGAIKEKKIEPIPRWNFILKNISIWAASILFFLVGIFVAAIFFLVAHDIELWDFLMQKPVLVLTFSLFGIFFFWGGISILFSLLSKITIEHTKQGYKYPINFIIFLLIILQVTAGFAVASNKHLRENILPTPEHLPFHEKLNEQRQKIWMNPEHGFLAGEILKISEDQIIIEDRKQKTWKITLTQTTKYPPNIAIKIGEKIRIQGKLQSKNIFIAEIIFPIEGNRKEMQQNMREMIKKNPEMRGEFREKLREIRENREIGERRERSNSE